jgi:hypothetical protein
MVSGRSFVRIARLLPNGLVDDSFDPGLGATQLLGNTPVWTILSEPGGRIFAGGRFSLFDGVERNGLAKLSADGDLDLDFVPDLPAGAHVMSLCIQPGGGVLVGMAVSGLVRLVNFPPVALPASLGLATYAGLSITGSVGGRYEIEFAFEPTPSNWEALTNLVLPSSPYLFLDVGSTSSARRFYRVTAKP